MERIEKIQMKFYTKMCIIMKSRDIQSKWIFYRIEHKSILIHMLSLLDKSLFIDPNHSSIREIHFRYLMFELELNSHSIFSNSSILIFWSFEIFRKTCPRIFQVLHFEATSHGYPSRNFSQFYLDLISGVFSPIPNKTNL